MMDDVLELEAPATPQLCVLERAGARFAVPAEVVAEVIALPRLTRVPLAPPRVVGMFSYDRSTVALLEVAPGTAPAQFAVVVRAHNAFVAVAADRVTQSSEVESAQPLNVAALLS
jgi:chemotaxis signal transduction protein